jgi:hypothetical protein
MQLKKASLHLVLININETNYLSVDWSEVSGEGSRCDWTGNYFGENYDQETSALIERS